MKKPSRNTVILWLVIIITVVMIAFAQTIDGSRQPETNQTLDQHD